MNKLTFNDFSLALTGKSLAKEVGLVPVQAISYHSKEVKPGTLFFCKGRNFKKAYLEEAIQKGARAYVAETGFFSEAGKSEAEKKTEKASAKAQTQLSSQLERDLQAGDSLTEFPIPEISVPDIRSALSQAAALFYDHPEQKLKIFAVTGTKGKTTTISYLFSILDLAAQKEGRRAGAISSAFIFDGKEKQSAGLSTPEPFELFQILAACVDHGVKNLALEVSSQALKYGRTQGLLFHRAGFTNIGNDHISPLEHPNFEDYFSSKLKIFKQSETAYVNRDADHIERILKEAGRADRLVTLSCQAEQKEKVDYCCLHLDRQRGLLLDIQNPDRTCSRLRVNSLGDFNAANALMAYAMTRDEGIPLEIIREALGQVRLPGRMDAHFSKDGRLMILVDYAHNGISFQTLFNDLQKYYPGIYTIAVWGAYGDKAFNRRKETGEIAGRLIDHNFVTTVGTSREAPEKIIQEIGFYIDQVGGHWTGIVDRLEAREAAYQAALDALKGHDQVHLLFLGKGTEDYILLKGQKQAFQPEGEVAAEMIERYNKDHPA